MPILSEAVATQPGLDQRFEEVMATLLQSLPRGEEFEEMRTAATEKLTKAYKEPKTSALEFLLQKNFSHDEARHLMFCPSLEQVKFYPLLIADPPEGAPKDHPQAKMQPLFLTLTYLLHAKSWEFMEEFMCTGGLHVLAELLVHENFYLRAQVFELFLKLTSTQDFEWFEAPKSLRQKRLHQSLLGLADSPVFVKNLLANSQSVFPGNSYLALQILAFWMSWVRKFYCKDNVLRLSSEILEALRRWSGRDDIDQEETDLAKKVYKDFNRFPAADGASEESFRQQISNEIANEPRMASEDKDNQQDTFVCKRERDTETKEAASHGPQSVGGERSKGNELFKAGRFAEAIAVYSKCLDLGPEQEELPTIYANRAMAYLKTEDPQDRERALADCVQALTLRPDHFKARYRKASALVELRRWQEAQQEIDDFQENYSKGADQATIKAFETLKVRVSWEVKPQDKERGTGKRGTSDPIPMASEAIDSVKSTKNQHFGGVREEDVDDSAVRVPMPRRQLTEEKNLAKILSSLQRRRRYDHEGYHRQEEMEESREAKEEGNEDVSTLADKKENGKVADRAFPVADRVGYSCHQRPLAAPKKAMKKGPKTRGSAGVKRLEIPPSHRFISSLSRQKNNVDGLEELLRGVEPSELKTIIKDSLTEDALEALVEFISQRLIADAPDKAYQFLSTLPAVSRFSFIVSFISAAAICRLQESFSQLQELITRGRLEVTADELGKLQALWLVNRHPGSSQSRQEKSSAFVEEENSLTPSVGLLVSTGGLD